MESFGERVRRYRIDRRMSCSQLAYRAGVTEGAIRRIERGKTKAASLLVGLRLAEALGVAPWILATGQGPPAASEDDDARDPLLGRLEALETRVAELETQRLSTSDAF